MICLPSSPISGDRAVCPLLVEPPTSLASISLSTAAAMSSTGGLAWNTSVRPVVVERKMTKHDGGSYVPTRRNIGKRSADRPWKRA
jgi:hypothetical protein